MKKLISIAFGLFSLSISTAQAKLETVTQTYVCKVPYQNQPVGSGMAGFTGSVGDAFTALFTHTLGAVISIALVTAIGYAAYLFIRNFADNARAQARRQRRQDRAADAQANSDAALVAQPAFITNMQATANIIGRQQYSAHNTPNGAILWRMSGDSQPVPPPPLAPATRTVPAAQPAPIAPAVVSPAVPAAGARAPRGGGRRHP